MHDYSIRGLHEAYSMDSVAGFACSDRDARLRTFSRKSSAKNRAGAQRRRVGLVHHHELGSEQRFHGAFSAEIPISQTVSYPARRERIVEPDSDRSESRK